MDSVFVGQHEHALDAKGRIVLPASFRNAFDPAGFLIKHSEGCLALMTPDRFSEIAAQMSHRSQSGGPGGRAAKRSFGAGAARVAPDKQGRIAVPEELRRFAGLQRDCVVIGAIDEVEIWDAERWQEVDAQGESLLAAPEGADISTAPEGADIGTAPEGADIGTAPEGADIGTAPEGALDDSGAAP